MVKVFIPNAQLCQELLVENIMGVPAEASGAHITDLILSQCITWSREHYLNHNITFQKIFLLPFSAI